MPGLTVTEKQHWKERIARRIDKRISAIEAEDPNLIERVEREARERALESLGLKAPFARREEIERLREQLQDEEERINRDILAQVRGAPVNEHEIYFSRGTHPEVAQAVRRRQEVFEEQLLAGTDVGARILALRGEKEELLDTV